MLPIAGSIVLSVPNTRIAARGCLGITCVDYCGQCEVRKCGMDRQSVNCGYCKIYPCQKLENQYTNMELGGYGEWATAAKAILEGYRSGNKIKT